MSASHKLLTSLTTVFVLGVGSQWLAAFLRIPSILPLLAAGFVAGPVTGWLDPNALFGSLLQPIVSISVALILFEGALTLRLTDLREIGAPLRNILSIGVLVTWVLITLGNRFIVGFDWTNALLLGALLVVTGPTVIGPLLLHVRPVGRAGPIARWEGIVIDPIGAVLAVLVFEAGFAMQSAGTQQATIVAFVGLFKTLLIAGALGTGAAFLLGFFLKRHWIPDHLQSPVSLMFVVASFAVSNVFQEESGLATVTILGVLLANQKAVNIRPILEFKENLSVLLISTLFVLLTARLEISELTTLSWRGPLLLAYLIFLVRPLSVVISTLGTKVTWRERIFLSWLAPRGIVAAAVASVFAINDNFVDDRIVPVTFIVIVGTVVVYGLTAAPLARILGLATPNPQGVLIASAHAGARAIAHRLQEAGVPVRLIDTNHWNIRSARMEGLPTTHMDVLAENAAERLDLGGIGRFLALTPNDEVNSLAALAMSEIFGRTNVYQLPRESTKEQRNGSPSLHLHGRYLFAKDANYWTIDQRFADGAKVKATKLTKEFTFSKLKEHYGDDVLLLFVVTEDGQLTVITPELEVTPRAGQTVITLADPLTTPSPEDVIAATEEPPEQIVR